MGAEAMARVTAPSPARAAALLEAALLDVLETATQDAIHMPHWAQVRERALCALDQVDRRKGYRADRCTCGLCPPPNTS